ncbi:hypothetical protein [Streptomyces sp. NPDC093097]|uniref:hypothetical protein n=1 Tax=Streptomyces sp. NPDC093097 TaxID=3366027 RepID=UPI003828235A
MPSVVGLLEQRELAARRRADGLREEAERIQAELAAAEQEWQEWVIVRRRVGTVLAPDGGNLADEEAVPSSRDADACLVPRQAAKPKSQVPVWREGRAWSVLSVDYQRILDALADRHRLHQGPLICEELAVTFGLDAVPAKAEALRSKAKRLVARGWLAERQPAQFTLAQARSGKAARHELGH